MLYTVDPERSADDAKINAVVEAPNVEDRDYDKTVRELAFEQRAKPKDRSKTEEELALEQKQTLERAERKRQRRMRGEDSDSEDENGRRKRLKRLGGDDLEDDFYNEDGFGPGLPEEGTGKDEEDEGEGGGENGVDSEDDEDSPESEAEGMGSAEEGDDAEILPRGKESSGRTMAGNELPYTFPCPETHDEFLDILEDIKEEDVPTVVHRIRTLHHPSLAEDNKLKLQVTRLVPSLLTFWTDTLDLQRD